jgi:RNA polymerase-binding transcription factor
MTPEQLDHFRQKLLKEREVLNQRILAEEAQAQRLLDPEEATEDIGLRSDLADTSLAVGTLLTRQLHEIDDALLRIELGEYGVCEMCGKPIELDRLEVLPAARLCEQDAYRTDRSRPPKL